MGGATTRNAASVLVISKDPQEAAIVKAQLALGGFWDKVFAADCEKDALHHIKFQRPALLVFCEPRTAGFDYRNVKARFGIPILVLGVPRRGRPAGADAYLALPYQIVKLYRSASSLVSGVRRTLEGKRRSKHVTLAEEERMYKDLFNRASDAIMLINVQTHRIVDVNRQAVLIYGYSRNEFLEMTLLEMIPREEHPSVWENTRRTERDVVLRVPQRIHVKKDGTRIIVSLSVSMIEYGGRLVFQDLIRDETKRIASEQALVNAVTKLEHSNQLLAKYTHDLMLVNKQLKREVAKRRRAEAIAQQQALYDELTGLPNRRLLTERLNQAILHAQRNQQMLVVMFMDLDAFKRVNDDFGHKVGDDLLVNVTQRLRANVRRSDSVFRLGGDEFIILLPKVESRGNAEHVAKKLIQNVSAPYKINGHDCQVGASIGITVYPEDGDNGDRLIRRADRAMYRVKKSGKSNYRFFRSENKS